VLVAGRAYIESMLEAFEAKAPMEVRVGTIAVEAIQCRRQWDARMDGGIVVGVEGSDRKPMSRSCFEISPRLESERERFRLRSFKT
jgi:hypothetical protein